ncbi:plasmid pRiA4b ORF-3 family protein [Nonomuraea insulae]|uniref:Plasmid pRiA4b ORF-3 family protein n=1 Tax=Nonomuraea insulae TaxID=1616787 RepID=A0ABW1CG73_9ACTN
MLSIAESPVFAAAHALAAWVGEGRAVTPGGALKPTLVPDAAKAINVPCPIRVRRLSDVPEVFRAWLTAVATEMVTVSGARAVRSEPEPDLDAARGYAALEQVIAAQVTDPCGADPRICCQVTLDLLAEEEPPLGQALRGEAEAVMRQRRDWDWRASGLIGGHPVDRIVTILREFGALDPRLNVTELGEHARHELADRIPLPVTPDLDAAEVLRRVAMSAEEDVPELLWRWRIPDHGSLADLGKRLLELLEAAVAASPAGRISAIDAVAERGESSEPLWRHVRDQPMLGPHARWWLGEDLSRRDRQWIGAEYGLAALERHDPVDAWYVLLDMTGDDPRAAVGDSGHPEAARLLAALPETPPRIPAYQLKISLTAGMWRRVLVPENYSLGRLHQIIRVLFGWSDSHLHVFKAGKRHYSDPFMRLEECGDEHLHRLNRALPAPQSTLSYTFDLGDCWRHEIVLEKVLTEEITVPVCVDGRGDNPIEDYSPDYPEEPEPLDRDAVNRALARVAPSWDDEEEPSGSSIS